jgi:hypothetical protein
MKHLIHLSLFESQNSEPVCDYYSDKKPDSEYFNFWSNFKKLNPEQKKAKLEEIKRNISELSTQNKKEYIDWYSNPDTIEKFSNSEQSVRKNLISSLIPNFKIKINTSPEPGVSEMSKKAWGYCSPEKDQFMLYVNLYNFYNGKPQGNKSIKDTIKHEMAHLIDGFLKKNKVSTYIPTHGSNLSPEEYARIYLINDRDTFARLNILRGVINAGPADSGKLLLEKFIRACKSGKIVSESFTFNGAMDSKRNIYILVMKPKYTEKRASLETAQSVYGLMSGKKAIMVDGKENYNIEQLFSNFAILKNGAIYVNMSEIAQVNLTTKSITR